ncbi:MAG: hypothetical protein NDI84_11250 [Steroidobacteraceae bacterium]|nr:hypothetical protein [Steroidobacteraceae bacterium]
MSAVAARAAESGTAVTYGTLPEGAIVIAEASGIGAEICRDLLLDPAQTRQPMPAGYRLLTARELAAHDPGIAQLLRGSPATAGRRNDLSGFAVGSLCFLSVGNAVVDGVRVHGAGPTPQAFLWARADGPRDPRMLGKVQWVQLASWYSNDVLDRDLILASDPTAEFVDLQMSLTGPNAWSMQLSLPSERVMAEVTGSGDRIPRKAPQPGFMSVALSGPGADRFQVFTYFGHHHQDARGTWRAEGTGPLTEALDTEGQAPVLGTYMQDGWQARYGVYRFE